ncbi:MAG: SDR family oxidoreductase [Nevskiales bacterium]
MSICNGRTVIITGAGAGLGREQALAFAAEGANIIVNDIKRENADAVAAEIVQSGAQALANSDDITSMDGAQKIVDAAVAKFGDVQVIVNNAGIVRDRMFVSLSEEDWDAVIRVHLRGHFCLAQILARRWRDQSKAGQKVDARIINTSSGAGLQGSVGQTNYGAAKAGIATLTIIQGAELGRYGITANAIAPAARTGMTEPVFGSVMKKPEDGSFDFFHPGNVAPLVVWLGSPLSAHVTGRVFEVAGGQVSVADGWRTGPRRDNKARWKPAELTDAINAILKDAVPPQKVYGT